MPASCFNPRPAFRPDATTENQYPPLVERWFQSSSGLSTGRYGKCTGSMSQGPLFQSSSGLSTGRYALGVRPSEILADPFQSSSGLSTGRYSCSLTVNLPA